MQRPYRGNHKQLQSFNTKITQIHPRKCSNGCCYCVPVKTVRYFCNNEKVKQVHSIQCYFSFMGELRGLKRALSSRKIGSSQSIFITRIPIFRLAYIKSSTRLLKSSCFKKVFCKLEFRYNELSGDWENVLILTGVRGYCCN